jgi:hypothetical protein
VAERSLLLPGVFSAKGVQPVTWTVKKKPKSDEPKRMVVLGLARDEKTFRAAERVMTIISNVALGTTPKSPGDPVTLNMIPPIHREWWLETVWEVVRRLNVSQAEHDVI